MNYGKSIRICRSALGLTQRELAGRLSIGASQLSLIESNQRQPSVGTLNEISGALHVPMHLLTVLASEASDLQRPEHQEQIADLGKALLQVLVAADDKQRHLSIK